MTGSKERNPNVEEGVSRGDDETLANNANGEGRRGSRSRSSSRPPRGHSVETVTGDEEEAEGYSPLLALTQLPPRLQTLEIERVKLTLTGRVEKKCQAVNNFRKIWKGIEEQIAQLQADYEAKKLRQEEQQLLRKLKRDVIEARDVWEMAKAEYEQCKKSTIKKMDLMDEVALSLGIAPYKPRARSSARDSVEGRSSAPPESPDRPTRDSRSRTPAKRVQIAEDSDDEDEDEDYDPDEDSESDESSSSSDEDEEEGAAGSMRVRDELDKAQMNLVSLQSRQDQLQKKSLKKTLKPDEKKELKFLKEDAIPEAVRRLTKAKKKKQPSVMESLLAEVVKGNNPDKDLPEFDGKAEHWGEFISAYERGNAKFPYSDEENLKRIKKSLTGKARDSVKALFASPSNVKEILASVREEFGTPDIVLEELIEKVKGFPKVTQGKAQEMIDFGRAVAALVTTAESLEATDYLEGPILLNALVRKLPPPDQAQWIAYKNNKGLKKNLRSFEKWLKTKVKTAIEMKHYQNQSDKLAVVPPKGHGKEGRRGLGVFVAAGEEQPQERKKCIACRKGHRGKVAECNVSKKMNIEERWNVVKDNRLCFLCLEGGHRVEQCGFFQDEVPLKQQYHQLLKKERRQQQNQQRSPAPAAAPPAALPPPPQQPQPNQQQRNIPGPCHVNVATGSGRAAHHIFDGYLYNGDHRIRVFIMGDGGSDVTMLNEAARVELGAKGVVGKIGYTGAGGVYTEFANSHTLTLEISGAYKGAKRKRIEGVQTVPDVGIPAKSLDVDQLKFNYPYLKGAQLKSYFNAKPCIIIGNDNFHVLDVTRKIRGPEEEDPIAVRCSLGWSIGGRILTGGVCRSGSCFTISKAEEISNEELHQKMKDFFALEDLGVKISSNSELSIEDKRALQIMEDTARFNGQRWEIGMLWKEDGKIYPSSYNTALNRLKTIENKMQKDEQYKGLYCNKIKEYLEKGFVRKLNEEEAAVETSRTRYLPHFGVTNPNKPGIRLVFDAAAKSGGISLNDLLLKGPDLNRPLIEVLMKFRKEKIALMGDISDMFHCVELKKEDRDCQRFLWRDGDPSRKPEVFEVTRLIFGATCSPTQAIFIKNKNAERFCESHPEAVAAIKEKMYVDDFLGGAATSTAAVKLQQDVTMICAAGGFPIRKWISNSPEVICKIPEDIRAAGVKEFCFESALFPIERALGVTWDPADDHFKYKVGFHKVKKEILEGAQPTKRQVTGLVMSLFDPLGFISNIKVKGMMLIQRCWCEGTGWDEKIDEETYYLWLSFLQELDVLSAVEVPRFYGLNENTEAELHTFVDASHEGYGAVSYLKIFEGDEVHITIVQAKARVSPIRKTTIPKLELQAALLGARLATSIKKELGGQICKEFYWSDSNAVLGWLRTSSRRLKEFIANRVSEIQELTNMSDWNWISTKDNIADMATRLERKISTDDMRAWTNGPEFLFKATGGEETDSRAILDGSRIGDSVSEACGLESEDQNEEESKFEVFAAATTAENNKISFEELGAERFSSYFRLKRAKAVAVVIARRWIERVRAKMELRRLRSQNIKSVGPLLPELQQKTVQLQRKTIKVFEGSVPVPMEVLEEVEEAILRKVQGESFHEVIKLLQKGKNAKALEKLSPFLDSSGIARVKSRIVKAEKVAVITKYPIILPKKHSVTGLIVDEAHRENKHYGRETILNNLRTKYWIISGRAEVKRAEKRCAKCALKKAKPEIPEMAPLPSSRLAEGFSPFTHTGVDLFGPIEVVVKRSKEKRYGIVWTCMVTRAVHVDVVGDLSTDEFLGALARFSSWIRKPKFLYSDNGKNFRGTDKELQESLKELQAKAAENLQMKGIVWSFQPPYAPHMSGVWERLVRSIKDILNVILEHYNFQERTLLTALAEVSFILNNRPLSYVGDDPNEEEALTLNHFLRGGLNGEVQGGTIAGAFSERDGFGKKQWRKAQWLAEHFWDRWRKEYLPTIMLREKWRRGVKPLTVGEVVVVLEKHEVRNGWKIGRVTEVFPDEAGNVWTIRVMVKGKEYVRPVAKVCPMLVQPAPSNLF